MELQLKEYVANKIAKKYKLNKEELIKYLENKARGRPKKEKRVISSMIKGEYLIERLIAEADIYKNEESEEEIEVKNFDYKGKRYLKAVDGTTIYSKETEEEIGRWNELSEIIEFE